MLHWCTMINFLKYCPKIVKYICWFEFLDHLKFEFLRSWWLYLAQQWNYLSVIRTKFANFDDCVPHSFEFPDFFPTFAQLYKAKPQLYIPKLKCESPKRVETIVINILWPFLVILLPSTSIYFTKLRYWWSFWSV